MRILGPFAQIITLKHLISNGPINDEALEVIGFGGIVVENGIIISVGNFDEIKQQFPDSEIETPEVYGVLIPGFIDCHTHICFGGNRRMDYAMRLNGKSYLEIAESGGGIYSTVRQTRNISNDDLYDSLKQRAIRHFHEGVTTIEIKSGYGLTIESELKMLEAINKLKLNSDFDIVPTCLAAHMKPKDFEGDEWTYLAHIVSNLFPELKEKQLTNRIDIFTEKTAFSLEASQWYINKAIENGFDVTVHADQFTSGSARMAVETGAVSVDHLENTSESDINILAKSGAVCVALPGASIGLGMKFTPARKLLDAGACLAIASDWNPGSAPQGNLLSQASILGTFEKISISETLAGLTFRAANALKINNVGRLDCGYKMHAQLYNTEDYRDIFYYQGALKPCKVWTN